MFDERFAREGMLVLEHLLPPDLVEAVHHEAGTWSNNAVEGPAMRVDKRRLHTPARVRGPLLDPALWGNPLLEGMLGKLLGRDYVIDSMTLVTALPGAPVMHLHRDFSILFPELGERDGLPAHAVTMIVPLIATDDLTGTTMIARSSLSAKKVDRDTLDPPAEWVVPHVPLGGCVLMDYRIWHRGMANTSDRERPILYIVFAREWFTDCRNFETHPRMLIERSALEAIDPMHRHRFRRAAGAGLSDGTIAQLGAQVRKADSS